MQTIDYPKVKNEIVDMHNSGQSFSNISNYVIERYAFKADVIDPVIKEVISQIQ